MPLLKALMRYKRAVTEFVTEWWEVSFNASQDIKVQECAR